MRILDLAIKDLSQIFRDVRALLFLVAMPIVFTLFMGFAYKSGENDASASDTRIPLGWVNNDPDGLLSQQLYGILSDSDSVKLIELDPGTVEDSLNKGEIVGALVVPAGYSERVTRYALEDISGVQPAQLTLLTDLYTPDGQSLFQLLRNPVTQVLSSAAIAQLSEDSVTMAGDFNEYRLAYSAALQAWAETDNASLVKVEMAVAEQEQAWYGDNPYNQASPGILVQFAIFGLVTSGQILVQERKSRTLQRMITTSLHPWQIVAGHTLAMFVVVFVQEALLVIFGQFVLGVNYGRVLLAVLLVLIALGLWIASMGLLIGVLAKDDSQVVLLSLLAMFFFSGLGGTWFPLEASSGLFAAIGRLTPTAWAMTGLQNILIRGLGITSAWQPVGILFSYALGFFLLATWRFQKLEL